MAATVAPLPKDRATRRLKAASTALARLSGADARGRTLPSMTEPLLWLDGDPTDGRRARVPEPGPEPTAAAAPAAPAPPPPRSGGRFRAALAGGFVSATLVAAGAVGLGFVDTGAPAASAPLAPAPASTSAGAKQEGDVAAIYAAASPSVVSVRTGSGSGTGFVVDADGTLVTNAHVVGDASSVEVQFVDDRTATAQVAGVDTSSDLAVLKVDTAQTGALRALELADSSTVQTGQLAVAIGSPFGLPQTATAGIVSGTGRHIEAPDGFQIDSVIQTDAPINPGNSGGPLLDANGRVIGVNSQIATGGNGNGNVGIGFAVPANTVRDVIPRLERGETIQRAYLGVATAESSGGVVVRRSRRAGPPSRPACARATSSSRSAASASTPPTMSRPPSRTARPGESLAVEIRRDGDVSRRSTSSSRRGRSRRRDRLVAGRRDGGPAGGGVGVSFQAPLLLLGLALLPLLAGAYVVTERRRRRSAAAFAGTATAVSVVPRRPGWRRHAPLALAGVAMAALITALARPQVSVAVPAEQARSCWPWTTRARWRRRTSRRRGSWRRARPARSSWTRSRTASASAASCSTTAREAVAEPDDGPRGLRRRCARP